MDTDSNVPASPDASIKKELPQDSPTDDSQEESKEDLQRKKRSYKKRNHYNPTLAEIKAVFHLPLEQAAQTFNICVSKLKKLCREHSIMRWPYRKIKSVDVKVKTYQELKAQSTASASSSTQTNAEEATHDRETNEESAYDRVLEKPVPIRKQNKMVKMEAPSQQVSPMMSIAPKPSPAVAPITAPAPAPYPVHAPPSYMPPQHSTVVSHHHVLAPAPVPVTQVHVHHHHVHHPCFSCTPQIPPPRQMPIAPTHYPMPERLGPIMSEPAPQQQSFMLPPISELMKYLDH